MRLVEHPRLREPNGSRYSRPKPTLELQIIRSTGVRAGMKSPFDEGPANAMFLRCKDLRSQLNASVKDKHIGAGKRVSRKNWLRIAGEKLDFRSHFRLHHVPGGDCSTCVERA